MPGLWYCTHCLIGTSEQNSSIINFISYTCAFPATTSQNVCSEKGLLHCTLGMGGYKIVSLHHDKNTQENIIMVNLHYRIMNILTSYLKKLLSNMKFSYPCLLHTVLVLNYAKKYQLVPSMSMLYVHRFLNSDLNGFFHPKQPSFLMIYGHFNTYSIGWQILFGQSQHN